MSWRWVFGETQSDDFSVFTGFILATAFVIIVALLLYYVRVV